MSVRDGIERAGFVANHLSRVIREGREGEGREGCCLSKGRGMSKSAGFFLRRRSQQTMSSP